LSGIARVAAGFGEFGRPSNGTQSAPAQVLVWATETFEIALQQVAQCEKSAAVFKMSI
jgi:hypothetical protein